MKTTILALALTLGLLFALSAHATVTVEWTVSGTVTAVKDNSIEIDGKSYPINVKNSSSSELANVSVGDKVSIEFSPANPTAGATQPVGQPVSSGVVVVNSAAPKSTVPQVHRATVTKPN